jgi:hypothetical protein
MPLLLFVALVAGCNQNSTDTFTSPRERRFAENEINHLVKRNLDSVKANLAPGLQTGNVDSALGVISRAFPDEPYDSMKFISFNIFVMNRFVDGDRFHRKASYELEYYYKDKAVYASITLDSTVRGINVIGLNAYPLGQHLEQINAFDLTRPGVFGIPFILLMVASFSVIVVALVKCILRKGLRKKWLGIVFIVVGIGQVSYNWANHDFKLGILTIKFLGIGYLRHGIMGPWMLFLSFPVGAVVFLVKYRCRPETKTVEGAGELDEPGPAGRPEDSERKAL